MTGPQTRRTTVAALAALAALAAPGLGATAARAQVPTLSRVDSLLEAGRYDEARSTLDRWWSAREEFDVPGSDRARGLMLRARLAGDVAAAEPDYLAVVLGYPMSEYAPEALLRLGQGLLAAGEPVRAAGYLQRLTTDYPGRPQRTPGLLWLARANTAARRSAAACNAARDGLSAASDDADMAAMLRLEEAAACAVGSADTPTGPIRGPARDPKPAGQPVASPEPARPVTSPAATPERPTPQPTPQATPRPAPAAPAAGGAAGAGDVADVADVADGQYAAQTGAFRYRQGARELMERLTAAGYEPRTVVVPANDLLRVRVGRLASAQDAARLVARLKGRGFDAYVVGDVRAERTP